jgi:hypothetical protein
MSIIGKRTYAMILLFVLKNVLAWLGIVEIPSEELSAFVDVLLVILAGVFRYFANRKIVNPNPPTPLDPPLSGVTKNGVGPAASPSVSRRVDERNE